MGIRSGGTVVIVGGVAGGASCAARLRRLREDLRILLVDRGPHVSFANCGLPYFVGQVIVDEGITIVETAGSNPAPHLPMFHDNGIKVLHKCTSVRHAVKAQSLGVDVRRLRWQLIVLSTMLTALATAVAGIVGFVGLVVPHVLRLAFGPDHRRLLPYSMLGGAVFLLVCDLVTRTFPLGLRLGVVTSLIGGPFFLWLLRRPR